MPYASPPEKPHAEGRRAVKLNNSVAALHQSAHRQRTIRAASERIKIREHARCGQFEGDTIVGCSAVPGYAVKIAKLILLQPRRKERCRWWY